MALLRQVPNRSRKLQLAITEELEQRLEQTKKCCAERHMELPFQESFEAWLGQLLDDAKAELNGRLPAAWCRHRQRPAGLIRTLRPSPTPLYDWGLGRSLPPTESDRHGRVNDASIQRTSSRPTPSR